MFAFASPPVSAKMNLVVTGASGYIGVRLVELARRQGHKVIAAGRRAPGTGDGWIEFDLVDPVPLALPSGVDAVIHLATSDQARAIDPDIEFEANRQLIEACRKSGARMVFVSSQTARRDAPTPYGRLKWRIEQIVAETGGLSVRPGQVYGGPEKGLFGTLVGLVRSVPVIPAFVPATMVRPVHVDDLAAVLLACATGEHPPSGVLRVGSEQPVSMTQFLRLIARVRLRRRRVAVPVPVPLIRLLARVTSSDLRTRLGLDRLMSLIELPDMETAADMERAGVSLRPLASGMAASGNDRRRRLAAEGRAMLAYVLKARPDVGLVRRYVRCLETIRSDSALGLPSFFLRFPLALGLLDSPSLRKRDCASELVWRLNAAVVLAEATPSGSLRFIGAGQSSGPLASLLRIGHAVHMEIWFRILAFAARPLTGRIVAGIWKS